MKNKVLSYVISIIFIAISFIASIDFMCFNRGFFSFEYKKLNVSDKIGISNEDLMKSTDVLLDYIKDKRDDINIVVKIDDQMVEMFNQREIDHMVDVKNLYLSVKSVGNTLSITMLVAIILYVIKNDHIFKDLIASFKKVLLILSAIMAALLTYAVIDFTNFWNSFHEIFFSNDLWLLNPLTDRMILMVPSEFFFTLIIFIVIIFIILLCLYYYILRYMYKREIRNDN